MKKNLILSFLMAMNLLPVIAADNTFKVVNPDYQKSPFTGMTRKHWIEADKYLLEGAFRHIKSLDDPMYFQKLGNVCYPQDETNASRVRGATLEGMARTLFMASTLIHENPNIEINGINLAQYYRRQLTLLVDSTSIQFVGHRGKRGPCQDLVEFGALGISLFICGDVVWDPLPQAVRDSLYSMIESYADGPTISQNWRFFNVFPMSFFKTKGYPINDEWLVKYVKLLIGDYRGDGWYWDNPNYDYYSMWAYQLYGKLWSKFFGEKYYPELAAQFEQNYRDMFTSYPYMFDRDGQMIMWGRSNLYRFASTAPLPWVDGKSANLGWMRRIASGCLLQFLENPDFLYSDGVPTPGWFGLFDPVLQGYSCRGSVYWCAKAFLPLLLTENDEYWSTTENEGDWKEMKTGNVYNHWYAKPKILLTNYPNSGASEIRAYCDYDISPQWSEKFRGSEQYNRLAYNSLFPWMADGKNGEVSMNYVVKTKDGKWDPLRRYTIQSFENGTMTRTVWPQADKDFTMTLTDTPLPDGMLREDVINTIGSSTEIRLGHYSLPKKDNFVITQRILSIKKYKAYIINNGELELVFIPLEGWNSVDFVNTTGLHPVAKEAKTINASATAKNGLKLKTLLLFKKGTFTKKELKNYIKKGIQ